MLKNDTKKLNQIKYIQLNRVVDHYFVVILHTIFSNQDEFKNLSIFK